MTGIFQKGYSFIGDVEKDNGGAEYAAGTNDLNIENICDANENENKHLAADAFEADFAGEGLVRNGAHDTGNVVHDHKSDQRIKQAVTATEKIAKPASNASQYELNGVPEFFNFEFLL